MAAKGIEQRHLFLLYQSVVLSVIDYELGLTTMTQINLLQLDRVQNEAMRVILGITKDTPTETMKFMPRPHSSANQTESEAGQSLLQYCRQSTP